MSSFKEVSHLAIQQTELNMEQLLKPRSATVYFRGEYSFRTLNGTMAAVISLLVSGGFTFLAARFLVRSDSSHEVLVGNGFTISAIVFGILGLYALSSWIANRRVEVEINEEGIRKGRRFWAWEEIRSFGGLQYINGVCLQWTSRWRTFSAPTSPLLGEQEYAALAHQLSRCVAVQSANVDIAMCPADASDTA
jgi:hypothetical protein